MKTIVVIPARYQSERFPGKILTPICGESMISHVVKGVRGCDKIHKIYIATDNEAIAAEARRLNIEAIKTSSHHNSGTERILEVIRIIEDDWDILINVQGDEPLITSREIEIILEKMENTASDIVTLARPLKSEKAARSPDIVKVVFDKEGQAHYFSRSLIPYPRNPHTLWYQHIGIYGFRKAALLKIWKLQHSPLEVSESLEQLRWLDNKMKITLGITETDLIGVDVPEDIALVEEHLKKRDKDT